MYEKKLPTKIKKRATKYPALVAKVPHKEKIEVTHKIVAPEVQKVEVLNSPVQTPVIFPETQKVEVMNPTQQKDIVFPDVQKVEVLNQTPIEFPHIQKVEITNPTPVQKLEIPTGEGNIAGKANPEKYVPVRLTDGKKFYKGLEDAWVSAARTNMPFVDSNGKPKPMQMTADGKLPVQAQIDVGDIEIGAVELKDATSDTRVVVKSDGVNNALVVTQNSQPLPTGAATSAKQDTQITQITDVTYTNTHTSNKELRTYQENHICLQNTTSTPLGSNATFTGEWQDCLNYQEVNVSIVSDKNSATNGLVFQWSADGTNIGDTDVFSYYTANGGTNYTPNPSFHYVRMVYTNGAVAQGSFSLQTILRRGMTGGSFHRIDSTLKDDADARLVMSVPKLKTAANTYVSQTATTAGNAKVSIEEIESGVIIPVNLQSSASIYNGSKTAPTGTAEAIATTQTIKSVTVKALSTNTVAIYVGATGVTTSTGVELLSGESVSLDIDNLSKVFVIGGSASQVVRYIAI